MRDQYILADKVRFFGDGVAAVAAVSEDVAEEALELIAVEYEVLPAVFDPEEAMLPGAPSIHGTERNLVIPPVIIESGDVAAGFAEADFIFEERYVTSRHVPAFMEPYVCICRPESGGKLTVWSSTQAPFMVRGTLSEVLGIPMSQIRVITEHMGGGFGAKQDLYQAEYLCALLAIRTGRPVKLEYTREETFVAGRSRHPVIVELKQGVKRDGTLTARQARYIANSGGYGSHGPGITWVGSAALGSLHKCPNVRIEGLCVYTNAPIAGAFRGYGAPQAYFALEAQMDVIAEALGMDPIELRLKNAFVPGDLGMAGTPFLNCELAACLAKGAELIGWENRKASRQPAGHGQARAGRGDGAPLRHRVSRDAGDGQRRRGDQRGRHGAAPDRRGGPGHGRQDGLRAGRGRRIGRALRGYSRDGRRHRRRAVRSRRLRQPHHLPLRRRDAARGGRGPGAVVRAGGCKAGGTGHRTWRHAGARSASRTSPTR